ncbi:MAG: hypothetical protein COA36_00490 [Desulfotalea sp.]|nr:MAG: hypothetical protein COA36_00490 [Desulfotalea sp.]
METEQNDKKSQLIQSLREAVSLVQMILFKEVRIHLEKMKPHNDQEENSILAGSITNEIFGTPNPEARFQTFREKNWGHIEQQLLSLHENHSVLCKHITDALRIQTLCDNQEGEDSSETLIKAKEYGYLLEDREIPLPSSFMSTSRELGKEHGLIIPPVQVSPEDDNSLVH